MFRELQRREWEEREAALMQQQEEEQQRRTARRNAVKELSGLTEVGGAVAALWSEGCISKTCANAVLNQMSMGNPVCLLVHASLSSSPANAVTHRSA